MEDFDAEEEDEEALIEQRRQQRLAIVQVAHYNCLQELSSFKRECLIVKSCSV